jgi:hypothetical protein
MSATKSRRSLGSRGDEVMTTRPADAAHEVVAMKL